MKNTNRNSKETRSSLQCSIDKSVLEAIVKRAFQESISIKSYEEIKAGRFNTTYKVNIENSRSLILRIAPTSTTGIYNHEYSLLRREYLLHPFFSSISEYTPRIIFADFTKQLLDRDYVLQSYIDGINWEVISKELTVKQNLELWNKLGDICESINSQVDDGFGLPYPRLQFGTWSKALINILEGMIHDLERHSFKVENTQKLLKLIIKYSDCLDKVSKPRLVHGDLWSKNILIKNGIKPKIVGVLDSERAFWGDPKAEWIIVGTQFAGKESKKGYIFRCGLFSADYGEIPVSFAKRYQSTHKDDLIRKQIYLGIYLTQRLIEAQRFPRNEKWIEEEFNQIFINLAKLN